MNIRRKTTIKGIQSILTYWYRGQRYRPVLGYNLTRDQEREAALQITSDIHANTGERKTTKTSTVLHSHTFTFSEFTQVYLQYLKAKRPENDGRNETILNMHLLPHFGHKQLAEIRLQDGLAYLQKRRTEFTGSQQSRRSIAAGTIERECAVLVAVLNLAVDMDHLDKNRLKRLPVPQYVKRERVRGVGAAKDSRSGLPECVADHYGCPPDWSARK
jgi:hypothetical protein